MRQWLWETLFVLEEWRPLAFVERIREWMRPPPATEITAEAVTAASFNEYLRKSVADFDRIAGTTPVE